MPAVSKKQQRWARYQLGQKRAGKPTDTKMSSTQLVHYARKMAARGTRMKGT